MMVRPYIPLMRKNVFLTVFGTTFLLIGLASLLQQVFPEQGAPWAEAAEVSAFVEMPLVAVAAPQAVNPPGEAGPGKTTAPQKPVLEETQGAGWQWQLLDEGRLQVEIWTGQSTNRLGADRFAADAYLFEQMAAQSADSNWAHALRRLAAQTRHMGLLLRQSAGSWFDGAPTPAMDHLRVREEILVPLRELNGGVLHTLRQGDGAVRETTSTPQAGPALQAFQAQLEALRHTPAAGRYPKAMALVEAEARRLEALALGATLRWETTYYCPAGASAADGSCPPAHMTLQAVQTRQG